MRQLKRLRGWEFTAAELAWLSDQALHNELAADILVRYNRRYSLRKPVWLPHRPRLVQ